MKPYFVSLRIEALEASLTLSRRKREKILRFAYSLADNPFQASDNTEHDSQGLLREIKIIAGQAVIYYVDDSDREVRIVDIRPAG